MTFSMRNRIGSGYTSTARPCGHNDLSEVSIGMLWIERTGKGKEYKSCNTCHTMHRRWWWDGKPNGWVSLVR